MAKRATPEGAVVCFTADLPPDSLKPNARVHWGRKAKDTKAYRQMVSVYALRAASGVSGFPVKRAKVRLTFYFRTNRRRDRDNLLAWFKAGFDGMTDGRLLADDSGITHEPVEVIVDPDVDPHVLVRVEPLP